jgi:hypothetical protein
MKPLEINSAVILILSSQMFPRKLDFVNTILVSPDCPTGWKDSYIAKLISDKLTAVDLKATSFQINRSEGSFISCLVQIEPVSRKKIEDSDFNLRNRNLTLKIM